MNSFSTKAYSVKIILCTLYFLAVLAPLPSVAACLDEAATYADRICGEIANSGSSSFVDASGDLTAEASSIIRRVLGKAGGSINVAVLKSEYENVLREHLADELKNIRGCRERMESVARKEACVRSTVYKTCRDASFGVSSWGSVEEITDATEWRDGWTQDAFCAQAIGNAISTRNIGNQLHQAEILRKWEDAKWGNATLRTDRKYRYHCQIRLSYNPVFNQRQDPICGIEP